MTEMKYPVTEDGRYFVVRGRLWRCANPALSPERRQELTRQLMQARRAVGQALRQDDSVSLRQARAAVNEAKIELGERGAPWWNDGAPDYNRHLAKNSPYAAWHASLDNAKK